MTDELKKELRQYLATNLTIECGYNWGTYYDNPSINIRLLLEEEVISQTQVSLDRADLTKEDDSYSY